MHDGVRCEDRVAVNDLRRAAWLGVGVGPGLGLALGVGLGFAVNGLRRVQPAGMYATDHVSTLPKYRTYLLILTRFELRAKLLND